MAIKISILLAMLNFNGLIIELTPIINKILKIFEPTMFPIAISEFLLKTAIIDVDNSGREVPNATRVIAIKDWLTPRNKAISTAPSTIHFAPIFKPINPIIIKAEPTNSRQFPQYKIIDKSSILPRRIIFYMYQKSSIPKTNTD